MLTLLLFILFMDESMRNIGVGGHHEELAYADDMTVVADFITGLQDSINI